MRFHVVSLPHTQTTAAFSACAFTVKVVNFCRMMKDRGHEVILYAGKHNEAPCDEHVVCISESKRAEIVGDKSHYTSADWGHPAWQGFNANVISAMNERLRERDFLCLIGGLSHKPIADFFHQSASVEFGIGYSGAFAKFRVYESHAWRYLCLGAETGNPQAARGNFYHAVIPGYLDPDAFPYRGKHRRENDYFLFVGRMNEDKGYSIAQDVCRQLGKRLILAGPGKPAGDYGEYVGVVEPEQRGKLMAGARALFAPSLYIEPFGNVAIEAMACGTPVISTNFGAFTETVIDGVTGFQCNSYKSFLKAAKKVDKLDPKIIRRHVLQNYSLKVVGKLYEEYFQHLYDLWGAGWLAGYIPPKQAVTA